MKLLVFAHTPPPHHGQSYMVKLMLDGLGGDVRLRAKGAKGPLTCQSEIECYHVDTRFSADIGDLGTVRFAKFFLVFRYCFEAIWCRLRYGVRTFYFAPAPPRRPALYRDWLVMLLCRPFFRDFIQHWHAAGLNDWLENKATRLERWVTRRLLGQASLGVVLAVANLRDPLGLKVRRVAIVPNGITDPFPAFAHQLLPRRRARLEARRRLLAGLSVPNSVHALTGGEPAVFRILYLAHCFRGKGIFETLDGVALAHRRLLEQNQPLDVHLTVAGDFSSEEERAQFIDRIGHHDLKGIITHAGFVSGEEKDRLLRESDCLCFPTYFDLESFGLVVVEAMAAGLTVITTRWRGLPEILPSGYPGFVPIKDPEAIAACIPTLFTEDGTSLRAVFLERFTRESHLGLLRDTLLSLKTPA